MNAYPKIIHQIWISNTNKPIPEHWIESQKAWQTVYSDYKYMLWNNDNVKDIIAEYQDDYDKFKYLIQKVDFLKFVIMDKFGGIFSDLDLVPLKRFDDVIKTDSDICLSKSHVFKSYFTNSFFIGKPGKDESSIWKLFINEAIRRRRQNKNYGRHIDLMRVTSSWMMTDVINNIYDKVVTVLPSLFNPKALTQNVLFKALQGESWLDGISKVAVTIFKNLKLFIMLIIILIVVIIAWIVISIVRWKRKCSSEYEAIEKYYVPIHERCQDAEFRKE